MEKHLLEISQVSKIYKMDGVEFQALDNVSLTINRGEFVAIMGPSGSGKSTLMHLIGCLDKPSSGTIFLNGHNVSHVNDNELARIRNSNIGFVFQQFNLLRRTSSVANVELPLIYADVHGKKRTEKAIEALKQVGLGDKLSNYPSQLSGGQQQRVAIARALVTNPNIILADEPTGNLDSKSGGEIMEFLTNLNKEEKTIIIVTHEADIATFAKRTILLKDGKIVKDTKKRSKNNEQ